MTGVLKARTAPTTWTPVGAAPMPPVWVGPDMPTDNYSLWWDTDEEAAETLSRAEVLAMLPTEHSAGGIGATSSGTTTLTVCTLPVPARSIGGQLTVRGMVRIQKTVVGDYFHVRICLDGSSISEMQSYQGTSFEWFTLIGVVTLAANTAVTLTMVVTRLVGTGTATTIAAVQQNHLQATYTPTVT